MRIRHPEGPKGSMRFHGLDLGADEYGVRRFLVSMAAGVAAAAAAVLALPAPTAVLGAMWSPGSAAGLAACDHDGLGTALRPAFEPAVGYTVVAVEVSGIDSHCAGRHVTVALTDQSGAVAAQSAPAVVPPGGGSVALGVPPVAVAVAVKVHTLLQ